MNNMDNLTTANSLRLKSITSKEQLKQQTTTSKTDELPRKTIEVVCVHY